MAFIEDKAAREGYEEVQRYFISEDIDINKKADSRNELKNIIEKYGPVIDSYPLWHPLVSNHDHRHFVTTPEIICGYSSLDHSRYFRNGFITCPYGDGQKVINSVRTLPANPVATIEAKKLDVQLYSSKATPILVSCRWHEKHLNGTMIPLSLAMSLALEQQLSCWRIRGHFSETLETMLPHLLGTPNGSQSSLFVDKKTGQAIRKTWKFLIQTGMFGPINA